MPFLALVTKMADNWLGFKECQAMTAFYRVGHHRLQTLAPIFEKANIPMNLTYTVFASIAEDTIL
jgi:hypothetical protein